MAQRQRPYLGSVVLEDDLMLGGVHLNPLWGVWQITLEERKETRLHLSKWAWSIYAQRGTPSVKPQCREQREQSVEVVSVQVRQKLSF